MKYPKITIVNSDNQVIGAEQLPRALEKSLIRQVVRVIISNGKEEIYFQQRSPKVMLFPSFWDNSAVGHVDAGETEEQAALREVREELGIKNISIQKIATYYREEVDPFRKYALKSFESLFIGTYRQDIHPPNWEVSRGKWSSQEEAVSWKLLTPGCRNALERYAEWRKRNPS